MSTKKGLFDDDSEEDTYVPGGAPQNPPESQATAPSDVVPAQESQNLDDEYVPQNYDDNQYQQPEAEYVPPVEENDVDMYKPEAQ